MVLEIAAAGIVGGSAWHIRPDHFAEQHGLIYIIALGEGIVAIGLVATSDNRSLTAILAITILLAVAGAVLLWWSYFDAFAEIVEDALRTAGAAQGPLARDA